MHSRLSFARKLALVRGRGIHLLRTAHTWSRAEGKPSRYACLAKQRLVHGC